MENDKPSRKLHCRTDSPGVNSTADLGVILTAGLGVIFTAGHGVFFYCYP